MQELRCQLSSFAIRGPLTMFLVSHFLRFLNDSRSAPRVLEHTTASCLRQTYVKIVFPVPAASSLVVKNCNGARDHFTYECRGAIVYHSSLQSILETLRNP